MELSTYRLGHLASRKTVATPARKGNLTLAEGEVAIVEDIIAASELL